MALSRIHAAVAAMGAPPSDLSAKVALEELQVNATYGVETPSSRVSTDVDLVSLPAPGHRAAALPALWDERV
jgi:hypothetical protein